MEQFSLDKYLETPTRKVCLQNGTPVRIICTDAKGELPIVALVPFGNNEDAYHYNVNGVANGFQSLTLFFADEKELTEFEKRFIELIRLWMSGNTNPEENLIQSRFDAKELLDLARKEIEKEDWRTPLRAYKNGYEQGKQDALKVASESLPKWKKATKNKEFDKHVLLFQDEESVVLTTELYKGEYYIELDELKNLSIEE